MSDTSSKPSPMCNLYIEDFKADQIAEKCPACFTGIAFHTRKPNEFNSSSIKQSSSGIIPSSIITSLPKWKVDYKVAENFLARFEQLVTAGNIPQSQWPRLLLYCVDNVRQAAWITDNILDAYPNTITSWSQVKEMFIKRFGNHSHTLKITGDYEACKQQKNESVQNYADRFTQLCNELGYLDDNKLVIQHYISGLSNISQVQYRQQLQTVKLANNGTPVKQDSLKEVIDLTLALSLVDFNFANNKDNDPSDSSQADAKSSGNKKKLHCKYHPDSITHSTAQCRLNPQNNNNPTTSNDSSSGSGNENKPTKFNSKGKPVKCHTCGGPHYANDPSCPKKSAIATRTQTRQNIDAASQASKSQIIPATPSTTFSALPSQSSTAPQTRAAGVINESIFTPKELAIMICFRDQLFHILLDSGSEVNVVDENLCNELNLSITPLSGTISLAHAGIQVPRVGYTNLDVTLLFPCTSRKAFRTTRRFEVLPTYDGKYKDYHFVIGAELIHEIFPDYIPTAYVRVPANHYNSNTKIATPPSINSLESKPLDSNTLVSHDSKLPEIDPAEKPNGLTVFTPVELEAEYSIKRASLLLELESLLAINNSITGFCNLPESIVKLEIEPSMKGKLYRRQYPIPQSLFAEADAVINRWFNTGKITLAPPNCEHNNPLTIAPKKDENGNKTGIRVCLDTRLLNQALIVNDRFPIPYIPHVLEALAGNAVFGEFDLAEAYLQFQLHPDSQTLTAFTWNGRQYMFVGCPYGVSPFTSYFQRVMTKIFYDLIFVFPYVDNLPYGSTDWIQHKEHTILIITRCNEANLRLKPVYNIGHAQMKCLGHVLSINGISPDPQKLQAVHDWPLPSTGKELQSFLGLCGFLRSHIRHYADITGPLESIKLNKILDWNDALIESFNATKHALANAPILAFPDFNRPFHIATDASNTGVGGVLFQPIGDEHITPTNIIAICSKKLQPHQQRWPAYKKELYGVVYSLRKFHTYVWGRKDLVVHTDHKPLIHMFTSSQLSPALQQWLDVLLDYHFDIIHRDGILNVIPDALSRMYVSHYSTSNAWGTGNIPFADASPIQINAFGVNSDDNSSSEMGRDESNASLNNNPELDLQIELIKRNKVCPDSEEKKLNLIQETHLFGHFGQDAVFKSIFEKGYWWPNIRKQIASELSNCDACNRYVVVKQGFHPAQFITANGPCDHIQIDTSVHLPESPEGFTALLVCICVFTGFVMLYPLKDTTAENVAYHLWKTFCIIGFPKIIQSDNGPEFVNEVIRAFAKLTGIEHRLISPYNPRADGKVERSIQTIMLIIKKLLHGTNIHWPLFVPFAQITFNSKISSLTGSSPFALMFGRNLNELKDYSSDNPNRISLDDWKQHQEKILSLIYPAISDRIRSGKDKLIRSLDKQRRILLPDALPNGSTVMIRDPIRTNKFEPKYLGPYTIIRRARNGAYVLKDATGDLLDRHVPVDQIKLISKTTRKLDEENPIYVVKKIVDHRGTPGNYEYLVDWKGYDESDRTWEAESQFLDQKIIQKYWKQFNSNSN